MLVRTQLDDPFDMFRFNLYPMYNKYVMDLNFTKLKGVITVIIAVVTSLTSGFMAGKHYLDNEFVNTSDFERTRLNMGIHLLENRKLTLETRLYIYKLCKISPNCVDKNVDVAIEKDIRELEDDRKQLDELKKKIFK